LHGNYEWLKVFGEFSSDDKPMSNFIECADAFAKILTDAPIGIMLIDSLCDIKVINNAAKEMIDFDDMQANERNWIDVRANRKISTHQDTPLAEELDPVCVALREKRRHSATVLIKNSDFNCETWAVLDSFPLFNSSGGISMALTFLKDITDMVDLQEIMHHHAVHDQTTGLCNRTYFSGSLKRALSAAKTHGLSGAILIIDLDDFKVINDKYGYAIGDDLLAKVGGRISSQAGNDDSVSRVGEDQFAVLIDGVEPDMCGIIAEDAARKICEAMRVPYNIQNNEIAVTASIGISIFPEDGTDERTLIKKADAAMYNIKANGRDCWRFYKD
jgi:diguanylate cyclase (GGDEF)-like protein